MAVRDKKKQTETGFITAGDRYLFGEGTHYEIYNKLGAHPKTFNGKTGYYFAVWAPHAASVSVVGDFNNWDPDACPMQVLETSGIYERFIHYHPDWQGDFQGRPLCPVRRVPAGNRLHHRVQ